MNKEKIEQIIKLLRELEDKPSLRLEPHNFRINSDGWKKITVDDNFYLVNSKEDIWEFADGKYQGEQLFTWDAAMRETEKAGKKIPTNKEFSEILKTKSDMPNLVLAGYRSTDGTFSGRTTFAGFWSSSQYDASGAWNQFLYSGDATVGGGYYGKAYGFSMRCLKD